MQPTRPPACPASSAPVPANARPAKGPPGAGARLDARRGGVFADLLGAALPHGGRVAPGPGVPEKQQPGSPAVAGRARRHELEDRETSLGPRRSDPRDRSRERDPLAAFQPLPPALMPPLGAGAPAPASGSSAARAEAAALAERLVTSLRVGRVGRDGHELRMKISLAHGSGVEVRLRSEHGVLHATLVAEPGARAAADRIAQGLASELRERGVTCESIEVA